LPFPVLVTSPPVKSSPEDCKAVPPQKNFFSFGFGFLPKQGLFVPFFFSPPSLESFSRRGNLRIYSTLRRVSDGLWFQESRWRSCFLALLSRDFSRFRPRVRLLRPQTLVHSSAPNSFLFRGSLVLFIDSPPEAVRSSYLPTLQFAGPRNLFGIFSTCCVPPRRPSTLFRSLWRALCTSSEGC